MPLQDASFPAPQRHLGSPYFQIRGAGRERGELCPSLLGRGIWQGRPQGPGSPPGALASWLCDSPLEASRNSSRSEHLGFCPCLVPSASPQPLTFLIPMCHGRVAPCQLANPVGQDRERRSVNGLQWGSRRGWRVWCGSRLPVVIGQQEEEVSGHVHYCSGVRQLLEHRG